MERARLTVSDLVLLLFGIAVLVGLYPVYRELLDARIDGFDPLTATAFEVVVPLALVVVTAMLAQKALGGTS